jgi:hypothetical protein
MADGSFKRIEDVKAGDKVLSRNLQTGKTETDVAEHALIFYQQATLVLKFADGDDIGTTAVHPFFVMGTGFVPAGQLKAGSYHYRKRRSRQADVGAVYGSAQNGL